MNKHERTKVALLIPCTSKGRNWSNVKETYLMNYSIKTFLHTQNPEYDYKFFIGIDENDPVFDNEDSQNNITRISSVFHNIKFEFIQMKNVAKGHLTKMWNILFQKAYDENYEYFFQCGDDIVFTTKNWVRDCIKTLRKNNNIGLTGPINNNNRILTQAFVSRKHMDIFGWFFPEEIINWCCDDWYNLVYQPNHFFPLRQHFCSNQGGPPRYEIDNDEAFRKDIQNNVIALRKKTIELAEKHKIHILHL
jgi:hypothetical protein